MKGPGMKPSGRAVIEVESVVLYAADPALYGPMVAVQRLVSWKAGQRVVRIRARLMELDEEGREVLGASELFLEHELVDRDVWAAREAA